MSAIKESAFFIQGFHQYATPTARKLAQMADYESRKAHRRPVRKPADADDAERFREASIDRLSPEQLVNFDRCSSGLFRTGDCEDCGEKVAGRFQYTCHQPLCPKCWLSSFFADWKDSRVAEVLPLNCGFRVVYSARSGSLAQVKARVKEWLKRRQIPGGVEGYGCRRTGPDSFEWYVTLITDASLKVESSRSFIADSTYGARSEAFDWLTSHYRQMLDLWRTPQELEYLCDQVKGKHRFQSFGTLYAATPPVTAEEHSDATAESGGVRVEATHKGGNGKRALKHRKDVCPSCGAINSIQWNGPFVHREDIEYGPEPDSLGIVRQRRHR